MAGFQCPKCSAAQTPTDAERAGGMVVCQSCGTATSLQMSDPFGLDDGIDLPAPKSKFIDLPAPKAAGLAAVPPPPGFFSPDDNLPAPVFRGKAAPLPVPVARPAGPRSGSPPPLPSLGADLPAPKGPPALPDLLAPVGASPPPLSGHEDLPAPVARNLGPSNLPAPKGFFDDAVAPKRDPFSPGADLPAPKGFFDDGVAPHGGQPGMAGAGDLPAPKGFFDDGLAPSRGAHPNPGDLPAPKGFFDDGVAPLGAQPNRGPANLPAPKGIFDDLAPPQTIGGGFGEQQPAAGMQAGIELGAPLGGGTPTAQRGAQPLDLGEPLGAGGMAGAEPLDLGGGGLGMGGAPGGAAGMNLDQLDLANPGTPLEISTGNTAPPPLDLGGPQRPFGLDDLELEAPGSAQAAPGSPFADVSLPQGAAAPSGDGVVSFSTPSEQAVSAGQQGLGRRRPQEQGPLELDQSPLPVDNETAAKKTLARERRSGVSASPPVTRSRKPVYVLAAILGVAAVGGGGYFGYTKYAGSKSTDAAVRTGVTQAREHLRADRPGHWDAAAKAAQQAVGAERSNVEALAVLAQARYAASLDLGTKRKVNSGLGKKAVTKMQKLAGKGTDALIAQGLQAVSERRPGDAIKKLSAAKKQNPRDPSVDLYMGWAHLSAREFEPAATSFEAALAASPNRVAALFGLGKAQQGLGKTKEARASYNSAIENSRERYKRDHAGALVGDAELAEVEKFTDREQRFLEIVARAELSKSDPPAISRAWALAGNEALRAGRVQEASQRYAKALELDPQNLLAVVGEAEGMTALGNLDGARERLTQVLGVDPTDVGALLGLSEVALAQENLTEVKQLLARVTERKPPLENKRQLARAHRVMADALALEPKGLAKAEAEFRKAISLSDERDISAALALARFLVKQDRGDEARAVLEPIRARAKEDASIAVSLGVAYLGAGDPVAAEETFRTALELRPGDVEARFQLGGALLAQERNDEGLAAIKAAYTADTGREDIGLALAVAYEERKRLADAAALYELLLGGESPSLNVKARAGRYFARHGNGARAIALGEEILAQQPKHPAGLFLLGEKHFAASEFDKAQRAYLDAAAYDQQAQYLEAAGRAAERLQLFDDALKHYETTVKNEPDYLSAILGQGRIYRARREFSKALTALDNALKIAPKNGWAHFARGDSLIELNRLKDAVEALERSVKLDKANPLAYFRLGRAYYDLDKAKPASSAITKAVAKASGDEPWLTDGYWLLGQAHRMAGNRRGAITAYRAYFDRDPPKGPARADAKRELLYLEGGGRL